VPGQEVEEGDEAASDGQELFGACLAGSMGRIGGVGSEYRYLSGREVGGAEGGWQH
jgi:hypothetical protein